MTLITEPQGDDMTGFDPTKERIVEQQAGLADGSIVTITKRVALSDEEKAAIREKQLQAVLEDLETKLIFGTITTTELARLDAICKLKQIKV